MAKEPVTHTITVADARRAIYASHGSTDGFSVEIRPNGALWIYAARGVTCVDGIPCETIAPSTRDRVLAAVVDHILRIHEIGVATLVEQRVAGVPIDIQRMPRLEIHPSLVVGVL